MAGGGVDGVLGGLRVETCGQTVLFVDGIRGLWTSCIVFGWVCSAKLKIIKLGIYCALMEKYEWTWKSHGACPGYDGEGGASGGS